MEMKTIGRFTYQEGVKEDWPSSRNMRSDCLNLSGISYLNWNLFDEQILRFKRYFEYE